MLTVRILCVGKLKAGFNREAMAEYQKRLQGLCRPEIIEIPEYRLPENPSQQQIKQGLDIEGTQLLRKAKGKIVPLCIEGEKLSSQQLSQLLKSAMNSPGSISFVIGSSFGLSDEVKQKGRGISMSDMTFPHGLARVMLTEQIYRGLQILAGSKYHK